jgi:hypothetical protein
MMPIKAMIHCFNKGNKGMKSWAREIVPWVLLVWLASSTVAIARPCCEDISDTIVQNSHLPSGQNPVFPEHHQLQSNAISHHSYCELLDASQIQCVGQQQSSPEKVQPAVGSFHYIPIPPVAIKPSVHAVQYLSLLSNELYLITNRLRI